MRFALVGDQHANTPEMVKNIAQAVRDKVDVIIQLGDFSYTGKYRQEFLCVVHEELKAVNLHLYWVDGNHDDHDELDMQEYDDEGFGITRPTIHHCPRGHRWNWQGVEFMSVGGAYSIDKDYRQYVSPGSPRNSWWPQETITEGQIIHASRPGNVDILFSHDVPAGIKEPYGRMTGGGNKDLWPESMANRIALRTIVDAVEPDQIYHGHCHHYYTDVLTLDNGHQIDVTGLARDTMANSYLLLEI